MPPPRTTTAATAPTASTLLRGKRDPDGLITCTAKPLAPNDSMRCVTRPGKATEFGGYVAGEEKNLFPQLAWERGGREHGEHHRGVNFRAPDPAAH